MKVLGIKITAIAAVFTILFLAAPLAFGQLSKGKKDTIFIGAVKVQSSITELARRQGKELQLDLVTQSLETQFINAVSATRVFQLVDRKRIKDIQLEQAFADVSVDKDAAKVLKMTGARYAFLPEIDGFEIRTDVDQYQAIGRESMTRSYFLSALVQIVNTTTGELLPDAPSVHLKKVETVKMAGAGKARGSEQMLAELAREMAARLSNEVIALLRPAKVLKVTSLGEGKKQILINRGTTAGFKMGGLVEIYHVTEVVDEDTGEAYRDKLPLCQAKVVRSNQRQSTAISFGDDLGITKGSLVEVVKEETVLSEVPPVTWSGGKKQEGSEVAPRAASPETPGSSSKPLNWGN